MKKYLSLLVIMLAFVMQSFTILPGQTQVFLRLRSDPFYPGQGPSRSPETNDEPLINAYLTDSSDSLLLYSSSAQTCTYNIYNVYEQEVSNGCVIFSELGEASIYLGTLDEGIYTISLEVDSLVYEGEFEIYN
jgi:hypothetical protein